MSNQTETKTPCATIMVVDDTPANLAVVVDRLEQHGFQVVVAQDGEEALQRAALVRPDLILLDVMMPGMDGFETCRRLKASEAMRDVPVIFMSALGDVSDKVKGFAAGGVDYVTKPFEIAEVLARVETQLALRRAERERDRSRAFLDQIIENVPATIIVKEASERRYVVANRSAQDFWGSPPQDAIGKTAYDIFSRERADMITAHDDKALRSDGPVYEEEHPQLPGGGDARTVTSTKIAMRDAHGKPTYIISIVEDVTERRTMERQLQQAQKMDALGQLAGGLAHDFNNLLTIIIGNLDLLQLDIGGNEAAELKVETILQASVRGSALTQQMLAVSRRQPLHPRRIDVNKLASETVQMLARTLGESVGIDLRMADDIWPILVDESQLQAALVNMAVNARDAMPGGGKLTIETSQLHLDAERISAVGVVAPGDYMVVAMRDSGSGMPPEVVAHIFDPFFTTKPAGHGTGLGLSMVYGFVKQSGAQIGVASEEGKGTTFTLYFPRAAGTEVASPVDELHAPRQTPVANGDVVLVVDDNPGVRATVVAHLQELGYHALQADCGTAALKILDGPTNIDLMFTDIVMPGGLNGKQLATKARALRPNLKILFTSGFPGAEQNDTMELEEGDVLLSKPYRKYELAQAVHEMLTASS
jgi:PAS domain S-box-containing protein